MATKQPKKEATKATFRQQASAARDKSAKPHRLRKTASGVGRPVKSVGKATGKVLRPFGVLLKPFRTRPMRFVGRILSKILFLGYFKASWQELRKVEWPGRKETTQLTVAVFMFAIVFGLIIAIVDYGLDRLFKQVLLK